MLIDYLECNPVYLLFSNETGAVWFGRDRRTMAFFYRETADRYAGEISGVNVHGPEFCNAAELRSMCFSAGAVCIEMFGDAKRESVPLIEMECLPMFYNNELNADVALLLSTRDQTFLQALRDRLFIVPARIKEQGKTEIVYGTVHLKKAEEYLYLAFTDLSEYERWTMGANAVGWDPLLVDFDTLYQIGRKNGVVINPFGRTFSLSSKLLRGIHSKLFTLAPEFAKQKEGKDNHDQD